MDTGIKQAFLLMKEAGRKGFFHLLSANFIIGFCAFASQLLVARFLTPVELGQIRVLQSFTGVAVILAGFGFNTAVLKLCSENRPDEEKALIFRRNFYYTVPPVLITLCILFFSSGSGILSPDRTVNRWLPVYMLAIPASVYVSLVMVYLQALKKIRLMAKAQVLIRVLGLIALAGATYYCGFAGFVAATLLIGYLALLPLLNTVKDSLKAKAGAGNIFPQSLYYAKWSVSANAVNVIGQNADIFMLNYLVKDRAGLGYYGLATIFILGMTNITLTAQTIALPYFSEKSGCAEEFIRVLWKYEKAMIILASGISVFALAAVPAFVRIAYGSDYAPVAGYFRVLVLKYFFWSCYAMLGTGVLGLGKMRYNFFSVAVSVPVSLVLGYFFITSFGIKGAAAAQALAYFITMVTVSLMTARALKAHFGSGQNSGPGGKPRPGFKLGDIKC